MRGISGWSEFEAGDFFFFVAGSDFSGFLLVLLPLP